MIRAADALDVQLALARMTRQRVSTRQLTGHEVQYLLAFRYLLTLDEDDLDTLARDVESDFQFRTAYDALKDRCLSFLDYLADR